PGAAFPSHHVRRTGSGACGILRLHFAGRRRAVSDRSVVGVRSRWLRDRPLHAHAVRHRCLLRRGGRRRDHRPGARGRQRGGRLMEVALAGLIGLFFSISIYLLLSNSIIRMLLGMAILGNGVNLLIFTIGRLTVEVPPIVPAGQYFPLEGSANPLPQALILTAIVIGFALLSFMLILGYRAYQELDADNTDNMRIAEPENAPRPPLSY